MDSGRLDRAEAITGHTFVDRGILEQSLMHASATEQRILSNERQEFLGDAILGVVICEYIFSTFPDILEGEMTKIKSTVVSRKSCAEVAERLDLFGLLEMGKGMQARSGLPSSIGAGALEAIIGAIFLDGGFDPARTFILQQMRQMVHLAEESGHHQNFKSVLQQYAQQNLGQSPVYEVLDEQGPDHAKCFEIAVEISDRRFTSCWGSSKKQAEQDAALEALLELGRAVRCDDGTISVT